MEEANGGLPNSKGPFLTIQWKNKEDNEYERWRMRYPWQKGNKNNMVVLDIISGLKYVERNDNDRFDVDIG